MARAKLYYIPGIVWHITHRCHNKDFLLKFSRDRKNWLYWLFQAKKRYGLHILNYVVTSNHIHLLIYDDGKRDVIPRSIQLTASRTAREYNQRKGRRGAFWEDHYHATAVETGDHLNWCMVYIDLNMVRAGVVKHPAEWPFCGYNEIKSSPQRYKLIDTRKLMRLLHIDSQQRLKEFYKKWIESALVSKGIKRESRWTESIAVGNKDFVEAIKTRLGIKVNYREIKEANGTFVLQNQRSTYRSNFPAKMGHLSGKAGD